jgi:hypothetical protein
MRLCRHCQRKRAIRARGLCRNCYRFPHVRQLYPVTSRSARRGTKPPERPRQLPTPTQAVPGSAYKISVLRERLSLGLELWHPEDAPVPRGRRRRAG